MYVMNNTSVDDVQKRKGDGITPSCVGVTPNVLPEVQTPIEEENSQTGVSTRYVPLKTIKRKPKPETIPHWYVIRCAYGSEKNAYEFFQNEGIETFYPTIIRHKDIYGKNIDIEESRIPNILFAYGSFDMLKKYVYDNVHDVTRHIRFYYNHHYDGTKEPLIVPDSQIKSLMIICEVEEEDVLLKPFTIDKFHTGQHVLVKDGPFQGVEGVVARFMGQQRVGITINGLFTIVTAYVPSAFLERIDIDNNLELYGTVIQTKIRET